MWHLNQTSPWFVTPNFDEVSASLGIVIPPFHGCYTILNIGVFFCKVTTGLQNSVLIQSYHLFAGLHEQIWIAFSPTHVVHLSLCNFVFAYILWGSLLQQLLVSWNSYCFGILSIFNWEGRLTSRSFCSFGFDSKVWSFIKLFVFIECSYILLYILYLYK